MKGITEIINESTWDANIADIWFNKIHENHIRTGKTANRLFGVFIVVGLFHLLFAYSGVNELSLFGIDLPLTNHILLFMPVVGAFYFHRAIVEVKLSAFSAHAVNSYIEKITKSGSLSSLMDLTSYSSVFASEAILYDYNQKPNLKSWITIREGIWVVLVALLPILWVLWELYWIIFMSKVPWYLIVPASSILIFLIISSLTVVSISVK